MRSHMSAFAIGKDVMEENAVARYSAKKNPPIGSNILFSNILILAIRFAIIKIVAFCANL
jgi:hypothetical protein